MIVLQNKLKISYEPNLSLKEIEDRIVSSYQSRQLCIQYDESLSLEYKTQLAITKETEEIKAATFLRNQNHIKSQRCLF